MIKLSSIKPNPDNPRLIKDDDFKKLCQSIEKFPKMMELRPIIVDQNNMIMGGNMRFKALIELGHKSIPDNWVKKSEDLTKEEWNQFIIKDNVSFGNWNFEMLANEWDENNLDEWGLNLQKGISIEVGEDGFELKSGDKPPFQQMTFTLADIQAESIKRAIKEVETENTESFGNENSNGNALYQIILEWEELKRS